MPNNIFLNHTEGPWDSLVTLTSFETLATWGPNTKVFAIALLAGVTTHLGYFIWGEHHNHSPQIVKFYIALDVVIASVFIRTNGGDLKTGAIQAAVATAAYLLGLSGSMAIYRLFLHPLRKFRGPFLARLSNLYHSSLLGNSDNYRVIYNLHKRYGPIVRTGMNSLNDVSTKSGSLTALLKVLQI